MLEFPAVARKVIAAQIRFMKLETAFRVDADGGFYSTEILDAEEIGIDAARLKAAFGELAQVDAKGFIINCPVVRGLNFFEVIWLFENALLESFRGNVFRDKAGVVFIQGVFRPSDIAVSFLFLWFNLLAAVAVATMITCAWMLLTANYEFALRSFVMGVVIGLMLFAPRLLIFLQSLNGLPARKVVLAKLANMRNQ
jgi:hypothetical protein